jgi:hypothetical protein
MTFRMNEELSFPHPMIHETIRVLKDGTFFYLENNNVNCKTD